MAETPPPAPDPDSTGSSLPPKALPKSLPGFAESSSFADSSGPETVPSVQDESLLPGTRIGEYEVVRVLGVGGFGIVYLCHDHALQREVALKEYMPSALAGRRDDGGVIVRSSANTESFLLGMRSFINEARLLARFDHPSLVKVHRFWEGNGTAYMVMPYYSGRTFKQMRTDLKKPPEEAWLRSALEALLGALELLHAEGVYHRDIAPDNVLVTNEGRPVLLDFGAARQVLTDGTQNLTAILKPHYAPIEQYADVTQMRQGPWTDLYALAATTYQLLIGRAPMAAAARMLQDELPLLADLKPEGCSTGLLRVLDWALAVRPEDRPQSAAVMRDGLLGAITVPERKRGSTKEGATANDRHSAPPPEPDNKMPTAPLPPQSVAAEIANQAHGKRLPLVTRTKPARSAAASVASATAHFQRNWVVGAAVLLLTVSAGALWQRHHAPEPAPPQLRAAPGLATPVQPMPAAAMKSPPTIIVEQETPEPPTVKLSPSISTPARPVRLAKPSPAPRPVPEPAPALAVAPAPAPTPRAIATAADGKRLPEVETRVPTPVRGGDSDPLGPRSACGARSFMALKLCMERECETSRFRSHPQCVRLREREVQQQRAPQRRETPVD